MGIPSTVIAPIHVCGQLATCRRVWGVHVPSALQIRGMRRIAARAGRAIEPAAIAFADKRSNEQIVHHRTYYSDDVRLDEYPTVITVYDMIHETRADFFSDAKQLTERKRRWCEAADGIIAISQHTKRELVRLFDIDPERVTVCHLGVARAEAELDVLTRLADSGPFLLYVGQRGGHKNFEATVRAFAASAASREGLRLIAFGGGDPSAHELELLAQNGVAARVSFTGGNDSVLAAHYATAAALIYPSLDEGFGLPPLEAMLHECPVAASNAGSIPEVVGDAALLFDPTDLDSIRDALDHLVADNELNASLGVRGRLHAGAFTWDRAAAVTLGAYADGIERFKLRARA